MTVEIDNGRLALVIHMLAKREECSHTAIVERGLVAWLAAERLRILAERGQASTTAGDYSGPVLGRVLAARLR